LLRVLDFLKGTINDVLTLEADNANTLTWHVDAFAAHANVKSHAGAVFAMGKGAISHKQFYQAKSEFAKLNRSRVGRNGRQHV
jgi:hypothetical protein